MGKIVDIVKAQVSAREKAGWCREHGDRAKRYRCIAHVLARHGLGYLVGILGLGRFVPLPLRRVFPGRANGKNSPSPPEHARMALQELGAAFIKLGQILSTRADLLPPEYLVELSKLQDAASEVPFEIVRQVLTAELGRPPEEVFASFDPQPLAAASIGQAHAATLLDGTDVVVKVRRPGVIEQVEVDLQIFEDLAASASQRWPLASQYDLPGLAREFAETLRAELDYVREGHNAERFAANFAGDRAIHVPRVFWETTTLRVLTLERIRGLKITDLDALDAAGVDREALAERAAHIILKMVCEDGFFHADPHPGNFFIEPGGCIGLIDFGMVGHVDERTQGQLAEVVLAVTGRDASSLVDVFLELGVVRGSMNRNLLRQDLDHMMSRYYGMELGGIKISEVINDALDIVRRHHLQLPSNLALLIKTLVMNEGLGARLDPTFNMAALLAPYAQWLAIRHYSPILWARRLWQAGLDVAHLATEMPQQVRHIIGEVERGGLEVGMRPEGFEPVVQRFERLANRIVLGIIAAAFINGLAILLSAYRLPGWAWGAMVAILFAIGFVAAVALGAHLAWSILRSGRG
jgi:ubiquinone biosynthesis protein